MVTTDRLQVPDLVTIAKRDGIGLIGPVLGEQLPQSFNPFPRGLDIWQNQGYKVLFTNSLS